MTDTLTARERQILGMWAEGSTQAEIGAQLYVCKDTVKDTLRRCRYKLNAANSRHAAVIAVRKGLI